MIEKEFKRKYYGQVLKINYGKLVVQGYCSGYEKDNAKRITNLILETEDGQKILKFEDNLEISVEITEEQYTMYQQARSFYFAAKRCLMFIQQAEEKVLPIPYMVNSALACEIQLKAILKENSVEYDNVHKLYDLFILLPDNIKEKFVTKVEKEFYENLLNCSDVFSDFRYLYENIYNAQRINLAFWEKFSES